MATLGIYLIGINILTFLIYGADKWKARRDRKFTLGVPAILAVQIAVYYFFLR